MTGKVPAARSGSQCDFRPSPVALGPQRGLRAVGHAELAEDPRQVRLDGLLADLQPAGDQLVRQALDEQREHLALARGRARRAGRAPSARSRIVRAARGSSGDSPRAAARMPSATSSDADVLEQVAARAGLERAEDPRAVGERRQHEHRASRAARRRSAASPRSRRAAACRGPSARRRAPARRARSTASAPSAAVADELDVRPARRSAGPRPSRITPWSSASRTRIMRRHLHLDGRSLARARSRTASVAAGLRRRGPRAASGRRGPRSRRRAALGGVEAAAVVGARAHAPRGRVTSTLTCDALRRARARCAAPRARRGRRARRRARPSVRRRASSRSPPPRSGLSRSSSAGSRPADSRRGGWISTSSVRRSRTPWRRRAIASRSTRASLVVAAPAGLARPAARARTRRRRGPARRRRAGRRRSAGARGRTPRSRCSAAARARRGRAAAGARATTRAAPGRAAARASPPISGGASAPQQPRRAGADRRRSAGRSRTAPGVPSGVRIDRVRLEQLALLALVAVLGLVEVAELGVRAARLEQLLLVRRRARSCWPISAGSSE